MSPRENPPQLPSRDSFNSVESVLEDKLEFSTDVDLHQSPQTHDTSLVEGRRVVFGGGGRDSVAGGDGVMYSIAYIAECMLSHTF